jgi:hypothetical protein
MSAIPTRPRDPVGSNERAWRIRAGIARTFGSLFIAICVLLLLLGGELFYDAFTHPLTAEFGQVLVASICVTVAFLLGFFMLQGRH